MPLAGLESVDAERGPFCFQVGGVGLVQNGGLSYPHECRVLKRGPGPDVEMGWSYSSGAAE